MAQTTLWQVSGQAQAVLDDVAETVTFQRWVSGAWETDFTYSITSGLISTSKGLQADLQFAALSANYATTSTTFVSTGAGVTLAPGGTRVWVDGATIVQNNTAADGVTVSVYRSTAGIPAQGTAPGAGDTAIYTHTFTAPAANGEETIPFSVLDTGLTAGTTYYYYLALHAVTGGTATVLGGTNQTTISARTA